MGILKQSSNKCCYFAPTVLVTKLLVTLSGYEASGCGHCYICYVCVCGFDPRGG